MTRYSDKDLERMLGEEPMGSVEPPAELLDQLLADIPDEIPYPASFPADEQSEPDRIDERPAFPSPGEDPPADGNPEVVPFRRHRIYALAALVIMAFGAALIAPRIFRQAPLMEASMDEAEVAASVDTRAAGADVDSPAPAMEREEKAFEAEDATGEELRLADAQSFSSDESRSADPPARAEDGAGGRAAEGLLGKAAPAEPSASVDLGLTESRRARKSVVVNVSDADGHPIPGASIRRVDEDGRYLGITDAEGQLRLETDIDRVEVQLEGFRNTVVNLPDGNSESGSRDRAGADAATDPTVDVQLEIAELSETIMVTAEAPLLDQSNVSSSAVPRSMVNDDTAGRANSFITSRGSNSSTEADSANAPAPRYDNDARESLQRKLRQAEVAAEPAPVVGREGESTPKVSQPSTNAERQPPSPPPPPPMHAAPSPPPPAPPPRPAKPSAPAADEAHVALEARSTVESEPAPRPAPASPAPEAKKLDSRKPQSPADQPYEDMFFESVDTNPFVDTEDDALSTFALDVDTGSYGLVRSYLEGGHLPPRAAVRPEEMVNYFDYGDPAPDSDADFALHAHGAPSIYGEGERYYLLRVGLRSRDVDPGDRPAALLTFVIDTSGSMAQGNRLELVKESLYLLVDQLREDDRVGLVIYGSSARAIIEPTHDKERLRQAIATLYPSGSTNAEAGLRLGYEMTARHRRAGQIQRVILCSDGVANVGSTSAQGILDEVRGYAEQGIELTSVGVGMGNYNDVLLEQLADNGNGRYAYVDDLPEARRLFVENLTGTLQTLAADARSQVEFDADTVSRYRLIGYENRDLADHRFRDDSADAGEIGAGHTVTAVYELKTRRKLRRGDKVATVRLRYGSVSRGEVVEQSLEVTGRAFARSFEDAHRSLRLAALVAEMGEILRGSYWAREGDLDDVFRRLQKVAADYSGDVDVAEVASLAGRAAKLVPAPRGSDGERRRP